MESVDVNYVAVIVAALVPMVLGALWYSPLLFARPWMTAVGRTEEELNGAGLGYALSAVAAIVTSYMLARVIGWAEADSLVDGALVGLMVWVGFVATVLAVTTYFGGRPRVLWFIDNGYQALSLLVMGAIHGAWN
jgi:hypothetical protein